MTAEHLNPMRFPFRIGIVSVADAELIKIRIQNVGAMPCGIHPTVHNIIGGTIADCNVFAAISDIVFKRGETTRAVGTRMRIVLDELIRANGGCIHNLLRERQRREPGVFTFLVDFFEHFPNLFIAVLIIIFIERHGTFERDV